MSARSLVFGSALCSYCPTHVWYAVDDFTGLGMGPGGSDLNATVMNAVWLNRTTPCKVVEVKGGALSCAVPAMRAGLYTVDVEVVGGGAITPRGFATQPAGGALEVEFPLVIRDVEPTQGSALGGTDISLSGVGFNPDASDAVLVGGLPCAIISVSFTLLVCVTPPPGPAWDGGVGALTLPITVNGVAAPAAFTYSEATTPVVVALSPRYLSSGRTGVVNLTLTNLDPSTPSSAIAVSVGSRKCSSLAVLAADDTAVEISCSLIRSAPPPLPQPLEHPLVRIGGIGDANASGVTLDVSFCVQNTSVSSGSLLGGTVVNFTGVG